MDDNAIRINQVNDVSQPTLGTNLTHADPRRPAILRVFFERFVNDPLRRRKAAQRFQHELAARDERLLLDIGLIRDQSVASDITGLPAAGIRMGFTWVDVVPLICIPLGMSEIGIGPARLRGRAAVWLLEVRAVMAETSANECLSYSSFGFTMGDQRANR